MARKLSGCQRLGRKPVAEQGLKIGFIGAGANTRLRHLPGFRAQPAVELWAVANQSRESSERVAHAFGIQNVATCWQEIVADPSIDAVCIGTWPDSHAEISLAALQAGKHVLVEARMARTVAEADTMLKAAEARPELVAQIVPSPFTLNADAAIKAKWADGTLGELREIVVEQASHVNGDRDAPLSWRQDRQRSGVNTLTLGICFEPLLRWLPGTATVVAADARVFTPQRRNAVGAMVPVEIPESLSVLGQWEGGARLVMNLTSVEPGANRCVFRLVGSRATLAFDAVAQILTLTDASGATTEVPISDQPWQGWAVEAQFVTSIRQGQPVRLTDFATGRRYMEFTEAVWQAWSAA